MKRPQNLSRSKSLPKHGKTKSLPSDMNQATADEFEREGMGVAPKE
jgi:hypothetical protein